MKQERVIYCPTDIQIDVWNAMSREEQIAWWRAQQRPPEAKIHMKKAISAYNKGFLTFGHFLVNTCFLARPEEIEDFVRECPDDLLSKMRSELDNYGEEDISTMRILASSCFPPWITPDEIEESIRQGDQQLRDGIRLMKKSLRCWPDQID